MSQDSLRDAKKGAEASTDAKAATATARRKRKRRARSSDDSADESDDDFFDRTGDRKKGMAHRGAANGGHKGAAAGNRMQSAAHTVASLWARQVEQEKEAQELQTQIKQASVKFFRRVRAAQVDAVKGACHNMRQSPALGSAPWPECTLGLHSCAAQT